MDGKITKIFNAADQIQAEMIHDHLKQNGRATSTSTNLLLPSKKNWTNLVTFSTSKGAQNQYIRSTTR
jgi:hypothetical protein